MNDLESKTMEQIQKIEDGNPDREGGIQKTESKLSKHLGPPDSEQWAFRDVKDTVEEVIAVVNADGKCPDAWKSAIIIEINASGFKGVRLDAQGHRHGGLAVWHVSVSKLF